MNLPRWQRVRELFDAVAEQPPDVRARMLAELTGDDAALRREVEELLVELDAGDTRLDRGPWSSFVANQTPDLAGTMLGPYEIDRCIGRGGMGDVYLAHRSDGQFTRRVAIKLIRPGMDSEIVLQRFHQERRILAGLNHASIAALLDAGVTDTGRPYFVMEFVEGEPITEYCTRNALSVDARVRLFRSVCDAVHFAHQSLVIHRDLKPANILVTPEGSVKLLDFGVAKLLRQEDEEHQTLTVQGARALTPSYASPEQVRGEIVTTASDVYSLGVILYELLAGRRPFVTDSGSIAEALRVVSTEEPTKPSAAIDDEPTRPQERDVRRALRRRLEGDLDNIVLMAIRKEPARRYPSAHDLAEDLRRFLDGLPVIAQEDTFRYRTAKFVGRHRASVIAAVVVLIAVVLGVAGTLTQAQRASVERARALQRMQDVRELASSLLFEVHDAIADLPGATEARRLILERGFRNLEEMAEQVRGDPALEWELAEAYLRVGLVQGQPTGASLGDLDGAAVSYTRAIEIASSLVEADSSHLLRRRTLALAHEKMGDVRAWTGQVEAGVQHATSALALYRSIAEAMPDSNRHQLSLAISLVKLGDLTGHPVFPNLGRLDEALGHYEQARMLLAPEPLADPPDWGTRRYAALVDERIGAIHRARGSMADARLAFHRSLAERERLAAEQPANLDALRDVGVTQQNLCEVELALGENKSALPLCRNALAVYDELHAADPSNAQGVSDVAVGSISLAGAFFANQDPVAALRTLEHSIGLLRAALEDAPDNRPNRLMLARALGRHTVYALESGRPAPHASEARTALETLAQEGATDADDEAMLAWISERGR